MSEGAAELVKQNEKSEVGRCLEDLKKEVESLRALLESEKSRSKEWENLAKSAQAELEDLKKEVESLRALLESEKTLSAEWENLAKRIQAEFDNYKKRVKREKEECIKTSNDRLVCDLLGTLDDLERALSSNVNEEDLRQGIKQIQCNLLSVLRSYGLREMPMDCKFNPSFHEAFATCEGEEGVIYETYQKGYFMGDRVIRHAKVKVGKAKQEGDQNVQDNRD
ncbi:MAG: nucleotide exchange factor GrpE [Methanomassiliicoccales archaeon]